MSSTGFSSSSRSVKEDESPPEKKQKFDDETLWRMLLEQEDVGYDYETDNDHSIDHSSDEREITDEELNQYHAAVSASDGFDVPHFPDVCCCAMIEPIILNDYSREELKPFCVAALKDYNEKKNTDYEFLRLEKANGQAVRGILYYLTFVGRIPKDNSDQIFEARVLRGIPENIGDDATEVDFCREKTSPATTGV